MITAFLDANVLYPVTQRAVLMELARADAFAPLWTEAVHQEWMRNLAAKEPHIKPAQIARLRALMEAYVGNVMVTGYEMLIDGLILPDLDDRHLLAAAIHGGASVIVTSNLKDFPAGTLALYNITAEHPDAFVLRLLTDDPDRVLSALADDRADLVNPPLSVDQYLAILERGGLATTALALRQFADRL